MPKLDFQFFNIPKLDKPEFKARHHLGEDENLSKRDIKLYDSIDILEQSKDWAMQVSMEHRNMIKDNRSLVVLLFGMFSSLFVFVWYNLPELISFFQKQK